MRIYTFITIEGRMGSVKEKEKFPAVGVEYDRDGLMFRESIEGVALPSCGGCGIIVDLEME
jgi:hypothetical protein